MKNYELIRRCAHSWSATTVARSATGCSARRSSSSSEYPSRLRAAAVLGALYRRVDGIGGPRAHGTLRRLPPRVRAVEELLPPGSTPPTSPAWNTCLHSGTRHRALSRRAGAADRLRAARLLQRRNAATIGVLAAEGCDVWAADAALLRRAQRARRSRTRGALRARRLIDLFDGAGRRHDRGERGRCGSTMKEYYSAAARDDPSYADPQCRISAKVRDVSELLAELDQIAPRHPIEARAAYHDACHLAHGQGMGVGSPGRCCGPSPACRYSTSPGARFAAGRPA